MLASNMMRQSRFGDGSRILGFFWSLCLLAVIHIPEGVAAQETKKKLIIDCDTGIDDAQAILMALSAPDVEIVAITTVSGNTNATQVSLNTLRVLELAGRLDVPVYEGSSTGLIGIKRHADYYHGKDGLGDVLDTPAPDHSLVKDEHAVSAIVRLANQHRGEVSLMAMGPLTNIALAIRMDPDLGKKLKGFYAMGGNHKGHGNTVPAAEFNFYADPEAAFAALEGLRNITLVTWETCMEHSFDWKWFERFTKVNSPAGRFIGKVYKTTIERHYKNFEEGSASAKFIMADQIIMALFISPSIVKETEKVYCTVETGGKFCRGQMVVDWMGKFQKEPNVNIVTSFRRWKLSLMSYQSLRMRY